MSDSAFGVLLGLIIGLCIGVLLMGLYYENGKSDCEETLPRNVECVWAAPQEEKR